MKDAFADGEASEMNRVNWKTWLVPGKNCPNNGCVRLSGGAANHSLKLNATSAGSQQAQVIQPLPCGTFLPNVRVPGAQDIGLLSRLDVPAAFLENCPNALIVP